MSRGLLDAADIDRISREIPTLSELQDMILHLSPDFLSMSFQPGSNVPIASVCLNEALHLLTGARYALHEVFAHSIWYLEKKDPPNQMAATFFGRFYADDAALRLYSAGEQYLVDALKIMLEIQQQDLKRHKDQTKVKSQNHERRQRKTSWLEILGDFLREQEATYPIADAVTRLTESQDWRATVDYRNRWVHEQPPTVKGLGIVHKRGRRWKLSTTEKGYTLGVGGGDVPEYSIHDLVGFIQPAMFHFSDTLTHVVKFYINLLNSHGISIAFS